MKRNNLNLAIDCLALVVLVWLASTGMAIYLRLPAGSGHRLELFGLSRHEWGEVHLRLGLIFLFLIVIHLLLHWNWLWCVLKNSWKNWKWVLISAVAVVAV